LGICQRAYIAYCRADTREAGGNRRRQPSGHHKSRFLPQPLSTFGNRSPVLNGRSVPDIRWLCQEKRAATLTIHARPTTVHPEATTINLQLVSCSDTLSLREKDYHEGYLLDDDSGLQCHRSDSLCAFCRATLAAKRRLGFTTHRQGGASRPAAAKYNGRQAGPLTAGGHAIRLL
jgi:hypothetical protein